MAVNLKNITELPVAESADGLNLIVNDNGSAKQIAASAVGAQADFNVTDETHPAFIKNKPKAVQSDWAETDETSAAFIKNKPVEEWDFDFELKVNVDADGNNLGEPALIIKFGTFESVKNKILNNILPKVKIRLYYSNGSMSFVQSSKCEAAYISENFFVDNPEMIGISFFDSNFGEFVCVKLLSDNTIVFG